MFGVTKLNTQWSLALGLRISIGRPTQNHPVGAALQFEMMNKYNNCACVWMPCEKTTNTMVSRAEPNYHGRVGGWGGRVGLGVQSRERSEL